MNNGWVKLSKDINTSGLLDDCKAFQLYGWILTNIDSRSNELIIDRKALAIKLNMTPDQIYKKLRLLQRKCNVIATKTQRKHIVISLQTQDNQVSQNEKCNVIATKTQRKRNDDIYKDIKNIKKLSPDGDSKERSEEELTPKTPEWLLNIPLPEIVKLKKDTSANDKQVRLKGEALYAWYKGDTRKRRRDDWKAVLRGALLKDFPPVSSVTDGYRTLAQMKEAGLHW